jgi:peptidoglycan/xylan/chitin deacetylase (PgdA/CDA1 family)
LIAGTAIPTQVVPLPVDPGPQLVPVVVITITATPRTEQSPTLTPTPIVDALALLVPTSTPTLAPTLAPTLSITEALEQPVSPSGLAGMMATANAESPAVEESATEEPTVTDAESPAEPVPTAASQPTPDGDVRTAHVPILMYHYLSVPPPDADRVRLDLSVTPDLFAAHLDAIQQAGYTPISLYTLLDHLTHGVPLPEKPMVLTFDDGYRDNYTNAFPLLRDRGLTATFFIVTDFINDQRPEYLTWDMVREMYAAGMSIEGHGRNHVSLANKESDYLIWQALGTYESIEHEIGVRPHFISYPAGDYDQLTVDIFRSANYWAGLTTQQGATHRSDDLFRMRRIRVRGSTSPEELLRLLELDW